MQEAKEKELLKEKKRQEKEAKADLKIAPNKIERLDINE